MAPLLTSAPPGPGEVSNDSAEALRVPQGLTSVFGKVLLQWHLWQLSLEQVDLVEEEDDGRPKEPARVDDRLEQDERLVHSVLAVLLEEDLIVLGEGDTEDDGGDGFEAVDPEERSRRQLEGQASGKA